MDPEPRGTCRTHRLELYAGSRSRNARGDRISTGLWRGSRKSRPLPADGFAPPDRVPGPTLLSPLVRRSLPHERNAPARTAADGGDRARDAASTRNCLSRLVTRASCTAARKLRDGSGTVSARLRRALPLDGRDRAELGEMDLRSIGRLRTSLYKRPGQVTSGPSGNADG